MDYSDGQEISPLWVKKPLSWQYPADPEEWPIKIISNQPYQNIIRASDDILIATKPRSQRYDIFHTTQGIEKTSKRKLLQKNCAVYPKTLFTQTDIWYAYSTHLKPFILLEANIKDKHKFLWVNLKGKSASH